jgi:tungstate transport system substrate-binding protein
MAGLRSLRKTIFAFIAIFCPLVGQAVAQEKSIVVASTTSTQDSGLFDYLLPLFTQKTGIAVKVLAQGTGQALDTGTNHEALLLRSHSQCCCFLFPAPTKQT